jgi:transcription-repair coupling factor (superfamily II helicase)
VQIDVSVDLPIEAYIPRTYVPDMRLKIDLYRRIARLSTIDEWEELAAELVDRFGPRPAEVDRTLLVAKLRIWAHGWQITSVHVEDSFVVFGYSNRQRIEELSLAHPGRLRIVDGRSAYLPVDKQVIETGEVVGTLESLLRPK